MPLENKKFQGVTSKHKMEAHSQLTAWKQRMYVM